MGLCQRQFGTGENKVDLGFDREMRVTGWGWGPDKASFKVCGRTKETRKKSNIEIYSSKTKNFYFGVVVIVFNFLIIGKEL